MARRAPLSKFAESGISAANDRSDGVETLGCVSLIAVPIITAVAIPLLGLAGMDVAAIAAGIALIGTLAFWFFRNTGVAKSGENRVHEQNYLDYEASKPIKAALPALMAEVQSSSLNIDTAQPGVAVYQGLQLGEVSRHFDSQTSASIEGWLNHNLQVSGRTVSYQRGLTGADYRYYDSMSVGNYSGSITGQSSVHLTFSGTTRDNLLADGFVAVLEQETTEGWMDTLRVIVPSEPAMREYVQQFIASMGKMFPSGSHRDAVLQQGATALAQYLSTDVSYVSDRLNAILRMPPEKRPVVAVIGTQVTAHAIVGGAMQFANDGRWHQLFPISVIQKMTALVEESAGNVALPS